MTFSREEKGKMRLTGQELCSASGMALGLFGFPVWARCSSLVLLSDLVASTREAAITYITP